jgi:hypothetical protein
MSDVQAYSHFDSTYNEGKELTAAIWSEYWLQHPDEAKEYWKKHDEQKRLEADSSPSKPLSVATKCVFGILIAGAILFWSMVIMGLIMG